MKRFVVTVLVVGLMGAVLVGLLRHVRADQPAPTDKDILQQLQKDLKAVQADVADWVEKHKALRAQFDTLKTAFQRHTHAVKFWDPEKKQATGWRERGTFFITCPKVGEGESDAEAAKAGGTWGAP